jgi:outer membrane protein assembly factor BamD
MSPQYHGRHSEGPDVKFHKVFHTAHFLLALFLFSAGCGGSRGAIGDSPEEAYEAGIGYFGEFRYHKAIESFQRVFEFGRVHDWADDAQFMLARSYYQDEQYLLASNEFERFIGLYPGDERIEEASFYRAMSHYQLSPPFNLDPTDTERAIDYLRLHLATYRDSEHREDIGAKIDELQEKLAKKLMEAARLYERSGQFRAARLTFERVLDEYPSTEPADEALLGAMRAQIAYADASILTRKAERLEEALVIYDRLYQLFPTSPHLKEAESLYDEVQSKLEELGG